MSEVELPLHLIQGVGTAGRQILASLVQESVSSFTQLLVLFRGGHRDPDQRVAAFTKVFEIPRGCVDLLVRQVIYEAMETVPGIRFHWRLLYHCPSVGVVEEHGLLKEGMSEILRFSVAVSPAAWGSGQRPGTPAERP